MKVLKKVGVCALCFSMLLPYTVQASGQRTSVNKETNAAKASSTGWIDQNGFRFYIDSKTGKKLTGFQTIENKKYYFYPSSGAALKGYQKIDGKEYYFDETTYAQKTGIIEITYGSKKQKHYFLPQGGLGTGWQTVGNDKYYFSSPESGYVMLTGAQKIDGIIYYFDANGKLSEGVYKNNKGQAYYYTKAGGVKMGLQEWKGDLYFCKESKSGEIQYGLQSIGKNLYYFDPVTGAARKNQDINFSHMIFTIGKNGVITSVKAEEGYENSIRSQLILNGMELLGEPYSFDRNEGYACGYFVDIVYHSVGITSIKGSSDQQAKAIVEDGAGTLIKKEELRPGDLVFWILKNCDDPDCTHWNEVHHVGIYLGNDKMLEASEPRGGVVIQDIHSFDMFEISHYARVIDDDGTLYPDEKDYIEIPHHLKAISNGAASVTVTWDSTENVDGFVVYRMGPGETKFSYRTMFADSKKRSFTDTNLQFGGFYYYRIYGFKYDENGKMVFSKSGGSKNYVWVKTQIPGVKNLKATAKTYNSVQLNWDSVAGVDGYIIYRKVGKGDFAFRYLVKGTSFLDTTALTGEINYYRVYPYKEINGKKETGASLSYVYQKPLPEAVTGLKAQTNSSGRGIRVTWNATKTSYDGYAIYCQIPGETKMSFMTVTKNTSFVDGKANTRAHYFYRIYAYKTVNGKQIFGPSLNYVYATGK